MKKLRLRRVPVGKASSSGIAVSSTSTSRPIMASKFTAIEAAALSRIFSKITETGKMDRSQFRDVLHTALDMSDDTLLDRMFRYFDHDSDGLVSLPEWLAGLSIFLKGTLSEQADYCFQVYDLDGDGFITRDDMFQLLKSSLRQPVATARGRKRGIATSRLATPTPRPSSDGNESKGLASRQGGSERSESQASGEPGGRLNGPGAAEDDPEEGARDLSEVALKLLDTDADGKVSLTDFQSAVKAEPLLLEVLGPCLPQASRASAVLAALGGNPVDTL